MGFRASWFRGWGFCGGPVFNKSESVFWIEVAALGLNHVADGQTIKPSDGQLDLQTLRQSTIAQYLQIVRYSDKQTVRQTNCQTIRQSATSKSKNLFVGPCGTLLSYLPNPATETLSACLPFTSDCLPFCLADCLPFESDCLPFASECLIV